MGGEKKRRSVFKKSKSRISKTGELIVPTLYVKVEVLEMLVNPAMPRCFVKLLNGAGLRAADRNGKSDPYCIVEVPGKPMTRFKTQVQKKTLNPEWKEEAEINGYNKGDSLQIQVYDQDRGKSLGDPLGSVLLATDQFDPS